MTRPSCCQPHPTHYYNFLSFFDLDCKMSRKKIKAFLSWNIREKKEGKEYPRDQSLLQLTGWISNAFLKHTFCFKLLFSFLLIRGVNTNDVYDFVFPLIPPSHFDCDVIHVSPYYIIKSQTNDENEEIQVCIQICKI